MATAASMINDLRAKNRRKLHQKIADFEVDESSLEFHRMTPLKSPTAILTGASDNCAGRNSILRYLHAIGEEAVEIPKMTVINFDPMSGPLVCESIIKLPVKLPGAPLASRPKIINVPIISPTHDAQRDFPIKLSQYTFQADISGVTDKNDTLLLPSLEIPKCGAAFDLYPFPSDGYDEGETSVFDCDSLPTKEELEDFLDQGIVKVTFTKKEGKRRVFYGTTRDDFIREDDRPKGADRKKNPDQICMYDIENRHWGSCIYQTIIEVKVKKCFYTVCGI